MRRANRGKGWETRLEFQHDEYRKAGHAVMFHAHPEVKVIDGKAIRSKGPPDFFGVASGVPVLFDAKRVAGPLFGFSNLKRHQAVALGAWTRNGGRAGVALKIGARSFWVDWRALGPVWWDWQEGAKRGSVNLAWLEEHAGDMGGGANWLVHL